MTQTDLPREELRFRLIEYLKREPRTQWENILQFGFRDTLGRPLSRTEEQALLELVHEFIGSGLLMPATDRHNTGWPWLGVTSHGRAMLEQSGPPVYDYEGYLADLRQRVPDLDSVVEQYVSESLRTYQASAYLASLAMLGCASERAIRSLINGYVAAIDDDVNRSKLEQRINRRDISAVYQEFRKSFDSTRPQMQETIAIREFDAHVDGMFGFTRLLRNSIMHPGALPTVTSALAYANLQQFSYYVETTAALTAYYRTHPVTV